MKRFEPAPPIDWRDQVVVIGAQDGDQTSAVQMANALEILCVHQAQASQFSLRWSEAGWALWPPAGGAFGQLPLLIDFVHHARFSAPLTLREPLARAAGIKAGLRPPIVDLTAGLGRDAWALASIGCSVDAFERHPLIYHLLADGLARARSHPATAAIAARIVLRFGAAHEQRSELPVRAADTVWLFDPMFPPRQKSAEVKKEMRVFAALVGADEDAQAVFSWARAQTGARWVLKRPHHATDWPMHRPDFVVESARLRFDVFLPCIEPT